MYYYLRSGIYIMQNTTWQGSGEGKLPFGKIFKSRVRGKTEQGERKGGKLH